jgi:hypothetical protein
MGNVEVINPIEDSRWDAFVNSHPLGWVCHLSGWKKVLENNFKHMKGYYITITEDHCIKAALPVYSVNSWLTGKRLISIPFTGLCDPLVSNSDEMAVLLQEARNLFRNLKSSYLEIRTLKASSFIHNNEFGVQKWWKHHFIILDKNLEELKKSFHRTCVRQRISRAEKSNLNIKVGNNESDLKKFYQLQMITRKRLGLPSQPYLFFKSIWETFLPLNKITLLLAEEGDQPIASLILFKFGNRVSAEFGVSDEAFRDKSPNHLLFWEAIKLAFSEGYKVFDFGRTQVTNKSLLEFKDHWGTQVCDLPYYYYPGNMAEEMTKKEEDVSFKFVKGLCEKAPDFLYKQIGNFCYRHLG